jgi:hypothetical protein
MKLQSAFEFMMIFAILLLALVLILGSVNESVRGMRYSKIEIESLAFIENARSKINTVYLEGDGFSLNLTLPENLTVKISDRPELFYYTFIIDGNSIILDVYGFNNYVKTLLTEDVNGSLRIGTNSIRNVGGTVVIS